MAAGASDDSNLPKLPAKRRGGPWLRRALLCAGCLVLVDALLGDHGLIQTLKARDDFRQASAGIARLKRENVALAAEIRRLEGDPAAIEAVAREKLGLVRPGEILVVVKDLK